MTVLEGIFRGHGNTRAPAAAALIAATANLALDPLLMFSYRMGVAGAAAATVASQYLAVVVYAALLMRNVSRGTMRFPVLQKLLSKRAGGQRRAETTDDASAAAIQPLALLKTVVSANAAMLLRTVSLMVSTCKR